MDVDVDVVVIGGGLAGLSASAVLGHRGLSGVVLEQGPELGGLAHSYRRDGFVIDPAIHTTSEAGKGQLFDDLLRSLGVRDLVEFMPVPTFYEARFPGVSLRVPTDPEGFYEVHAGLVPSEAPRLREFLQLCGQIFDEAHGLPPGIPLRELDATAARFPILFRYQNATLGAVLDEFICDPRLKAALGAFAWAYMAMPPRDMSFLTYAQILTVAVQGTYAVRGGFQSLVDALTTATRRRGVDTLVNHPVERIEVSDGRVSGVVATGRRYRTRNVIATASARHVIEEIVGEDHVPAPYLRRLRKMVPSWSGFAIFAATTEDLVGLGVTHDTFVYDEWDEDAIAEGVRRGEPTAVWVNAPTILDPGLAPGGQHLLNATALAPFDVGRSWRDLRDETATRLLEKLNRLSDGLGESATLLDVATPATYERYTANLAGAIGGWAATPRQSASRRLPIRTPIDGLYLAGQWTQPGGGTIRTCVAGVWAAQYVLHEFGLEPFQIPLPIQRVW